MNQTPRAARLSFIAVCALAGFGAAGIFTPAPPAVKVTVKPAPVMPLVISKPVLTPPPVATPVVVLATPAEIPAAKKFPAGYNFALATHGASAKGGRYPEQLIDGNDSNYTTGAGFAYTQWTSTPPQAFTVALKDPYTVDCVRFLLWDRDDRHYKYRVEICGDESGVKWDQVADYSREADQRKGWQEVRFPPQTVKFIRVTGTFNSTNSYFHIIELQAFHGKVPAPKPPTPEAFEF